jgi:hypothetical protein
MYGNGLTTDLDLNLMIVGLYNRRGKRSKAKIGKKREKRRKEKRRKERKIK